MRIYDPHKKATWWARVLRRLRWGKKQRPSYGRGGAKYNWSHWR